MTFLTILWAPKEMEIKRMPTFTLNYFAFEQRILALHQCIFIYNIQYIIALISF
jgi:hypothetical protein